MWVCGWEGGWGEPAPPFVASYDSLDVDCCLVQGLAPLYLQQSVLVILEQRRSQHVGASTHLHTLPGARTLSPEGAYVLPGGQEGEGGPQIDPDVAQT